MLPAEPQIILAEMSYRFLREQDAMDNKQTEINQFIPHPRNQLW